MRQTSGSGTLKKPQVKRKVCRAARRELTLREGCCNSVYPNPGEQKKASRKLFSRLVLQCRGEPRCTFVNEIIGLPLALSIFPEVHEFPGDAVLELVERGLYRKGSRLQQGTDQRP
jgi:hypothetical protein